MPPGRICCNVPATLIILLGGTLGWLRVKVSGWMFGCVFCFFVGCVNLGGLRIFGKGVQVGQSLGINNDPP